MWLSDLFGQSSAAAESFLTINTALHLLRHAMQRCFACQVSLYIKLYNICLLKNVIRKSLHVLPEMDGSDFASVLNCPKEVRIAAINFASPINSPILQ